MRKNQTENQNKDIYQTGSTNPPKSYQGIIAILLILVIFLGGIVSALSMLNIRLFHMLEQQLNTAENDHLQFSRHSEFVPQTNDDGIVLSSLGLTGQEVTELCRSYYGWPEGLYISGIHTSGPAAKANLRTGDILLTLNGIPVANRYALAAAKANLVPGQTLLVTVYRQGCRITVPLTPEA